MSSLKSNPKIVMQMNKKEKKKMHYFKLIYENQPIRPEELRTKCKVTRVNYGYIDELCYEQKIERAKYGKYALLFIPGNRHLADEKYKREVLKNREISTRQPQDMQLDFKPLIEEWQKELLIKISIADGIRRTSDVSVRDIASLKPPIESHVLYSNFEERMSMMLKNHPDFSMNPFIEWDKFCVQAQKFLDRRTKLITALTEIISKHIDKKSNDSLGEFLSFQSFLMGILARLDHVGWHYKSRNDEMERFFLQFDSQIEEKKDCYLYNILDLRHGRYLDNDVDTILATRANLPEEHLCTLFITKDKNIKKQELLQTIDKKIEVMLKDIIQSPIITDEVFALNMIQLELHETLNNIHISLEKIKSIKNL